MFTVTVSEKDGQQSTFNFDKTEVSIGRVKGNDIVLPKGNVSKRHSRIVVKDAKFIVIDLKSTNGTYVNGRKINSPQVIKEADKVYIGDFVLTVVGEAGASPSVSGSMGGMSSSGIPQMKPPAPPAPPLGGGPPPLGPSPTPTLQSTPAVGSLGRPGPPGPPQPPKPIAPPRPVGPPRGPIAPPQPPPQPPRVGGPPGPPRASQPTDIGADAPTPQPMQAVQPDQRATQPGLQAQQQPPAAVDPPSVTSSAQPAAPQAPPPAGPAAVMAAGALAVPLSTPGAAAVPTPPDFVSRFDQNFAEAQIQVGEAFFASVDPLQLPTFYPPAPEDREQYEPIVQDILAQVGRQDMFDHLLSEVIGLGPLEDLLDDPSIEEIYVNSHDQLLYRQHGQVVAAERGYTHPDFLYLAAQRLLSSRGEEGEPMMDEVRFSDGTRVTILMPPLAPRGPVLTVRKAPAQWRMLEDLVQDGVMNSAMAEFLGYAIEAGRSIVIGGAPRSGRLEVLNALGNLISDGTRIVTIEDSASLRLGQHSAVSLEMGSGPQSTYDMRYLIRAATRMQPERLLVHPLQDGATYDWVSVAAGGAQGSMAVCNGSSAHDVLGALEAQCISGAPEASVRGLREQIARAVQLVVVMRRLPGGAVRVHQIAEVVGLDLNTFRVSEIFAFHNDAQGGYFRATGYTPRFYDALQAAGIPADTGIFRP